ncbi:hypothetical protein, partial [Bacillus altitudinis]|uniref:hypothetical protein n=1 Tax=Bacillus altitudinis TaxID=293387 RepID=UPI001F18394C
MEDLKELGEWGRKRGGDGEFGDREGVDGRRGGLGEGIAMGAGMALGERDLAERYNKDHFNVVD